MGVFYHVDRSLVLQRRAPWHACPAPRQTFRWHDQCWTHPRLAAPAAAQVGCRQRPSALAPLGQRTNCVGTCTSESLIPAFRIADSRRRASCTRAAAATEQSTTSGAPTPAPAPAAAPASGDVALTYTSYEGNSFRVQFQKTGVCVIVQALAAVAATGRQAGRQAGTALSSGHPFGSPGGGCTTYSTLPCLPCPCPA